ncbi:hypothetical protein, variant 1 [Cryptococcus amylolentus CBS 6039]|uniref:Prolyl endopeptidase n=1 Tax=Cryptococcus amylolentus CBS 6039 TaxID=1295533 RepID=A0A1E3I0S2_9TREE|nr:hypothetical protein, variant 1 [Cryptococcus amylolentus CBS 6039]ODN82203.1 hypothetical protein, variant 1 [Cryptococcus amylolentus CBS 6039]
MGLSASQLPHTRNKTSSRSPVKSVSASGFTVKPEDWTRSPSSTVQYPHPPQAGGITETIFGIEVKDPWRALEDLESDETKAFVKAQNELSIPRLSKHPLRKPLEAAVAACYNHAQMSNPELQGNGYYYWRFNPGTAPRDVIVRSKDLSEHFGKAPGSEGPDLFYDLNEEEKVSLYAHSFSPSGRLWCAVLQYSGSDWQRLRIIDTRTKEVLERDLGGSKFTFGVTWVGEKGFIYKRSVIYDPSNDGYDGIDGAFGMFYHAVGQPQSTDVLIWSPPNGVFQYIGKTKVISVNEQEGSGERAWLALDVYRNTSPETELLVIELPGGTANPVGSTIAELVVKEGKWLSRGFTGETRYIGSLSSGRHFFTSFTDGHSTGRIIAFDSAEWETTPDGGNVPLQEIIPDDPSGYQLQSAHVIGDQVIALIYLKHACASVVFVDARTGKRLGAADAEGTHGEVVAAPDTQIPVPENEISRASEGTVVIPEHGAITSVSARPYASDFYFTVDTWVAPSYVLKGAIIKNKAGSLEVDISNVSPVDDAAPHETLISCQVFYDSHDGTRIPMFICHSQDLDLSKPHPLLLHAYGGFCAPVLPHYDPMFATFMRNVRGIVAIAGIRGGGEYGTAWHQAAIGVQRSVGWDDFASAAIHLQFIGLTTPSLTAIYGSSNGGLLMSASTIRHPELFEVVFVDVALTDLVRYHKFGLGRMWMDEYGSPDDSNDFSILLATSPLHNVNPDPSVEYPAMLITTGDHDNRVMPGHSLKFIAELQGELLFLIHQRWGWKIDDRNSPKTSQPWSYTRTYLRGCRA